MTFNNNHGNVETVSDLSFPRVFKIDLSLKSTILKVSKH